jgi:hypothetical protein
MKILSIKTKLRLLYLICEEKEYNKLCNSNKNQGHFIKVIYVVRNVSILTNNSYKKYIEPLHDFYHK